MAFKKPTVPEVFESARLIYQGTRRGHLEEFKNFQKHRDYKKVVCFLEAAIESQIKCRKILRTKGQFVPPWKNFKTWINQRCWTEEPPLEIKIEMDRKNRIAKPRAMPKPKPVKIATPEERAILRAKYGKIFNKTNYVPSTESEREQKRQKMIRDLEKS